MPSRKPQPESAQEEERVASAFGQITIEVNDGHYGIVREDLEAAFGEGRGRESFRHIGNWVKEAN